MKIRLTLATLVIALWAHVTPSAIFVRPDIEDVPTDRIIANLEQQIADNPSDAALHARLARLHSLAYAQQIKQFPVDRRTGEPWFGPGVATPPPARPAPFEGSAEARQHLAQALTHYRESLALAPNDLVVRLGYAWTLDSSGDFAAAISEYRAVIERAWVKEREKKAMMPGEKSLAVEAGGYLEHLLDRDNDKAELDAIRQRREQIGRLPRAITPIAIPLRQNVAIGDLVDSTASVAFDADGSALPRRWTWISRDAAWLVFDPRRTGRITSALQLFGSVTFWTFWPHGYEALRALDDDRSGELRGRELAGLALWHDANGNGISDAGEVRPIEEYGIVAISVHADLTCGPDVLAISADGVQFRDGTRRPTYDVILRSVASLTN